MKSIVSVGSIPGEMCELYMYLNTVMVTAQVNTMNTYVLLFNAMQCQCHASYTVTLYRNTLRVQCAKYTSIAE